MVVVALVFASLAALAPAAVANYGYVGSFSAPGAEPGQLSTPGRAAVEQSTGNLFVVDSGNDRVQVFAPNGEGTADYLTAFGTGELSAPWGIAIAESGGQTSVYVADAGNEQIVKYDSDEAAIPAFTLDASFKSPTKGSGSGEVGSFKAPLAIDPSSGDLLLADNANKLIQRFEADGDFLSAFDGSNGASAFEGPIDLAVNSAGDVYVVDANGPDIGQQQGTSRALRYTGAGAFEAELTPVGPNQRPATVAIDPDNGDVLVSGEQDSVYRDSYPTVHVFDDANGAVQESALSAQYTTVSGLAAGNGRLYVVLDVGNWNGSLYGNPGIQAFRVLQTPTLIIDAVDPGSVTQTGADASGSVDPNGLATEWWFEYAVQGSGSWQSTPVESAGSGEDPVPVSAELSGLQPNRAYVVKLVAENGDGGANTSPQSFVTGEGPPTVYTHRPVTIDEDSAYLRGTVVPNGLASTYYFEWGTDTSYGSRLPVAGGTGVGAGLDPVLVAREAIGLQPGTTYHYRIVAENAQGVTAGPDMTFTTETGTEPEYGYEMVSPQEKNGGYVAVEPGFLQGTGTITEDGQSAMFTSKTSFAGQQSSAITNTYRTVRAAPTWTVTGLTPPVVGSLFFYAPSQGSVVRVAEDHSAILTRSYADPVTKARQSRMNLYFRDLSGGPYVQLTPDPISGSDDYQIAVTGSSSDLSRIVFRTDAQLLPEAPESGLKVYVAETATGELSLGNVTGGEPGTPTELDPEGPQSFFAANENLLSADGRRLFFGVAGSGLMVRDLEAGETTPLPGRYLEATPDGRYVFVSATAPLVPADTNSGSDLYRLDLDAEPSFDPVLISADAEPSDGADGGLIGVAGIADDGDAAFFTMQSEQLVAGGPLDPEEHKIYSWQGGELSFVGDYGQLASSAFTTDGTTRAFNTQVSPDGSAIAFKTDGAVVDDVVYDRSFLLRQMYLYDADDSTPLEPDIACASCLPAPNPTPAGTFQAPLEPEFGNGLGSGMFRPQDHHYLTDDARLFFEAEVPLIPEDVNGFKSDVYAYDEGELELISSGRSPIRSVMFAATPDGSSVLFATAEQLSGWDEDGQIDAYVARLGDILPGPPPRPPACQGDGCLAPPTTPDAPTPASSVFKGAGNEKPAGKKRSGKKRCPQGKARKGGKCVKKGKASQRSAGKYRAGHNRRAGK